MRISDWSSDVCSSYLQSRQRAALAVGDVVEDRRGGVVVVPVVHVGGLELPHFAAGVRVQCNDAAEVFLVERAALAGPEIRSGVAGGQVDQAEFLVGSDGAPDVWRGAGVGLAGSGQSERKSVV